VRVWVRYPKSDRLNLGQMEAMKIKTPFGDYPLSELATYDIERGPVNIRRYNSEREVRINAELVDPKEATPPILEKIRTQIVPELETRFPGVHVEFQGQRRTSTEAIEDLINYFILAFSLMLLVIMFHFKSISQGLIIILMIPLGWLGAIWGHGVENIPVSMLSVWGMIALSGVIINDAVVFLSKFNNLVKEGKKVEEAAYEAGLARFRAIILTTITTTVGLYPIIFENSFQAQFLIPMAVALAYGVFVGTGFILIFFPALIIIINDIRGWLWQLWTGQKHTREEIEPAIRQMKKTID